jgi:hypothetical protein
VSLRITVDSASLRRRNSAHAVPKSQARANAVTSLRAENLKPYGSTSMSPPSTRLVSEIAAEPDRAAAYARLLHLQRGCADDPSSAADLAAELPSTLLPLLIRDAVDPDEAVAASALKCLGFALYHPVLVSTISGTTSASLCTSISSVNC